MRLTATDNQAHIDKWEEDDSKNVAFIAMHVNDTIQTLIDLSDATTTAKKVWDQFKELYGKQSAMSAFVNFRAILTCSFNMSLPLTPQVDTLVRARAQLASSDVDVTDQQFVFILKTNGEGVNDCDRVLDLCQVDLTNKEGNDDGGGETIHKVYLVAP